MPARKFVPVRVAEVPPAAGPTIGVSEVSVGAATKVNALGSVADPPTVATETSTTPAA